MTRLLNPQIGHPLIIENGNLNSNQEIKLSFLFASNKPENELAHAYFPNHPIRLEIVERN